VDLSRPLDRLSAHGDDSAAVAARLALRSAQHASCRLAAWLGHAPALWLLYREPLPRSLRLPNVLAVLATLAAMAAAWFLVADLPQRVLAVVATWLVGHVAWGTYLTRRLPPSPEQH
jgi:RsiW-degrading membrane proteinase PrsW (M82 family)